MSSPRAVEPGPFAEALRRSVRTWAVAAALAAVATLALARTFGALPCVHAAAFLLAGLVGIPLLFPLALGAAMAGLWSLLAVVAVPWWLVHRRATGLAALWRELAALLGSLLPGYWRALRRVDRPVLWGLVLGFVVGSGLAVACSRCDRRHRDASATGAVRTWARWPARSRCSTTRCARSAGAKSTG